MDRKQQSKLSVYFKLLYSMFLLVLSCFRILPTGLFLALLDWMCCLWLCSLLLMVSCWLKVALVLASITQWSKIENFVRKLYGQKIVYLYGLQMSTMRVIIFQKIKKTFLVTKSSIARNWKLLYLKKNQKNIEKTLCNYLMTFIIEESLKVFNFICLKLAVFRTRISKINHRVSAGQGLFAAFIGGNWCAVGPARQEDNL